MFLLVSGRHVGAHLGGPQHGVPIQISMNLEKTFLRISSIRKLAVTWILARVFAYLPSFYFQILDSIYWTVLIFYFDLFWMAWHWKPAIHPIRNGSSNWCRSVTDRDVWSLCVSLGQVGGSSWWCRFVTVCQFAMDLKNMFGGVMVCGENISGSDNRGGSQRPVTTVTDGFDSWPFVSLRES